MNLNLNREDLERIIEALRKDCQSKKDEYLIGYLEIKKEYDAPKTRTPCLDEIPF